MAPNKAMATAILVISERQLLFGQRVKIRTLVLLNDGEMRFLKKGGYVQKTISQDCLIRR